MKVIPYIQRFSLVSHKYNYNHSDFKQNENFRFKNQLSSDVFEFSNSKNISVNSSILSFMGVRKTNLEEMKNATLEIYDYLFQDIANETKEECGLEIEKPILAFKKPLVKSFSSGYTPNYNIIVFNPKNFQKIFIKKDLSKIEVVDDVAKSYFNNAYTIDKKSTKNPSLYRKATSAETLAVTADILSHELTHAKQFQQVVATKGMVEEIFKKFKEQYPNLSDIKLKMASPFIFSYKPNETFAPDAEFIETTSRGVNVAKFTCSASALAEDFLNYDYKNSVAYAFNILEICAKSAQAKYWQKIANGILPKPDGIDDETIKYIQESSVCDLNILLNAMLHYCSQDDNL